MQITLRQTFLIIFVACVVICLPDVLGLRGTETLIGIWLLVLPGLGVCGLLAYLSPNSGMTLFVSLLGMAIGCFAIPSLRGNLQEAILQSFNLDPEWQQVSMADRVGLTAAALLTGSLSLYLSVRAKRLTSRRPERSENADDEGRSFLP